MVETDSENAAGWLNGEREQFESSFLWSYFGFESSYEQTVEVFL